MWLRKALKPTRPPTSSASKSPTMMNQRSIRTGRARVCSTIGSPVISASATIFMSDAFCGYRLTLMRRQCVVQMRGNCGFVKPDATEDEFAKLPLKIECIVIGQAWNGWQPHQRRHQHGMMGKPEQVERIARDPRGVAGGHGAIEGSRKWRPDQFGNLAIEQPGEFAIVEMARDHQPKPLRFLLVVPDLQEMPDHAPDQFE